MFEKMKPAIALFVITLVAGISLGFVFDITKGPIAEQKALNEANTVAVLIPGTTGTESRDVAMEGSSVVKVITCLSNGEVIGYAITAAPKGYSGAIELMVGFDTAGIIQGVEILSQTETPGLGANAEKPAFTNQFKGKSGKLTVTKSKAEAGAGTVDAITSATITSNAVTLGVNDATEYFEEHIR
ncbi:MAG: RnfABCDGE type electron transport complex subunit G, partial [Clostridiales bacterium]|jgi:electron transport complex protein RnfG|nr:RnfABCDGE type electron transport complex subunit G [Clostridiales bacterium]